MAASEVRGELKFRDGETKAFTVKTENNLKSLIGGVKKLSSDVSEVLTALVEREKCLGGHGNGDSRGDDEEEDDDSDEPDEDVKENDVIKSNTGGPPTKRPKVSKP